DPRLFPFDVSATWDEKGRVVLDGHVGYEENRASLLEYLNGLGFEDIEDRIEVLPSKSLGEKRFGFVRASRTFSFDRPSGKRTVVTDCLLGAPLCLLKEADDEFILCQGVEGYIGYVAGKNIQRVGREDFARYQAEAQVRVRRDFLTPEGLLVPMGARLKFLKQEESTVVAELPAGGKITIPASSCEVRDGKPGARIERVIENASKMLGAKYVWGGNTAKGIDCSGLVQIAFAAEGIHLARDAGQQAYLGWLTATRENRDGLRRGDILYFLGKNGKISHTALYVGDGRYLEAVRPVVRYTSFNPESDEYDAHRAAAFCFAKRLLD
ncbi:MAG: C40 family peptidase, partial [Pirellulaceae bacterium]|nr:C40 family peptidase [Pirellulaceae bacterium]